MVPNLVNFASSQNLQIYKFEGADLKYDNNFLKLWYLNKAFCVRNLYIFNFPRKFAARQIETWWFQIWKGYFQIPVQNYPNKVFFVPSLKIFIFKLNFRIRQIWQRWFQIWQKHFWIPAQKYVNQVMLVQTLRIFVSAPNFAIRQNRERWPQKWQ